MPPVRRYLRITKYSVLECRIYLDNPADAQRWLLNARDPVLPRVIEAVRPFVLPKLREENARAKSGKSGKKKGWKDVVTEDDFEVVIFLTETSSRHAILKKEKMMKSEKPRLGNTDERLTGMGTKEVPMELGDEVNTIREESQEDAQVPLTEIPSAGAEPVLGEAHSQKSNEGNPSSLSESSERERSTVTRQRRKKVIKEESVRIDSPNADGDDKKKMALNTNYDGFSIYGRILCLVVKRRGIVKGKEVTSGAMMEDWISSTQAVDGQILED